MGLLGNAGLGLLPLVPKWNVCINQVPPKVGHWVGEMFYF